MNDRGLDPSLTAAQLRRVFDESFAKAALTQSAALEDFLAIRLADQAHALRLADIAHVLPVKAITGFPSPVDELLGVIGFRGAIVPTYDLRMLLGHATQEPARWMVIAAVYPVALAFDSFDGHVRVPREASARHAGAEQSRRHVQEVLHVDNTVSPVVSVASILETIQASVQRATN